MKTKIRLSDPPPSVYLTEIPRILALAEQRPRTIEIPMMMVFFIHANHYRGSCNRDVAFFVVSGLDDGVFNTTCNHHSIFHMTQDELDRRCFVKFRLTNVEI